jgi:hypothetical protein
MAISRRTISAVLAVGFLAATGGSAVAAGEEAVAARVEAFRAAQLTSDPKALDGLCAPELSYSHSDGRVQDKAVFVADATSGRNPFTKVEYRDPTVRVAGDAAVVRFHWLAEQKAAADGKVTNTDLHILMVWQQRGSDWVLLARSATKL